MPPRTKSNFKSKDRSKSAKAVVPGRPFWVSEELWELGQSTAALADCFKKPDSDSSIPSGCTQVQVKFSDVL
jgi:hypothetical protein